MAIHEKIIEKRLNRTPNQSQRIKEFHEKFEAKGLKPKAFNRPSNYKPEFPEMLIEHMAQGLSFTSFGGIIGVPHQYMCEWEKKYPDFKKARAIGDSQSLVFWEKLGKVGIMGKIKSFNASAYIFSMKNKFNWTDRNEIQLGQTDDYKAEHSVLRSIDRKDLINLVKKKTA